MNLKDIKTQNERVRDSEHHNNLDIPTSWVIGSLENEVRELRTLANYLQGYKDAAPSVHHTHNTYAMPIPDGYRFSQVGNIVDVSPIDHAMGAPDADRPFAEHQKSPVVNTDFLNDGIHQDDRYIDAFALMMKWRMKECRILGKGGWDNPDECSHDSLAELFLKAVNKGNPIDIANYCMMIYSRAQTDNFSAQGLISDHAAVDEEYASQQVRNGETMLKVQAALGITDSGWVSGDVVLARLSELKLRATVNTGPGTPIRAAIEAEKFLAERDAVAMSVGLPVGLPYDFKRRIPLNRGKNDPITLWEAKVWADIESAIASAVKEKTEHISDLWPKWPGDRRVAGAMFERFAIATEALNLRGLYLEEIETRQLWSRIQFEMEEAFKELIGVHTSWIAQEWPRWPGIVVISSAVAVNIKALADEPPKYCAHHPV